MTARGPDLAQHEYKLCSASDEVSKAASRSIVAMLNTRKSRER
jgi:hypothetical protein